MIKRLTTDSNNMEQPNNRENSRGCNALLKKIQSKFSSSKFNIVVCLVILVAFGALFFIYKHSPKEVDENTKNTFVSSFPNPTDLRNSNSIIPVRANLYKDPFEEIKIKAQAAYVFDVTSGKVLYEYNKNKRLPLASLTKLMTALVATKTVGSSELVSISEKDIEKEGSSGLLLGEKWKLNDLLDFTLVTSSNDGASAIASAVGAFSLGEKTTNNWQKDPKENFIEKMNKQAKTLSLPQMEFFNESGLDLDDTKGGAYGTAQEMAMLFEYILKNNPEILEATSYRSLKLHSQNNFTHIAKNTNTSVNSFPGLLASKTGYTDLAGGNLGVAFDSGIGTPIIIVVLGSTFEGRFEDVEKLYEASLEKTSQGMY